MMTRSDVLATACAVAAGGTIPLEVRGQSSASTRRIGFISPGGTAIVASFRSSLADIGYVNGRNIHIDSRAAIGQLDRLPELAPVLVGLNASHHPITRRCLPAESSVAM